MASALATLIQQAAAATGNYLTTSVDLANGGTLFCSHRKRASNSRGARRGQHYAVEFNYRAPGEQYSKRCSREDAATLIGGA